MATTEIALPTPRKPLRLWPGIVAVALQWIGWFLVPAILPQAVYIGLLAGVLGGLAILLWWLLFSRARCVGYVDTTFLYRRAASRVDRNHRAWVFSVPRHSHWRSDSGV